MRLNFTPLMIGLLAVIFISVSSAGASSDSDEPEAGVSPLYEYRYSQAAESLGILDSDDFESKLDYSSISTPSLNPRDQCQGKGCQPTVKDSSETSSASCGLNSCVESNTCGYSGSTCYSTCTSTCSGCSQTYGGTCAKSCSSTCSDTCGSNTCASSTCTETCSSSCGLASCGGLTACGGDYTCGQTCSSSCGGTCAYTCYNSCYSTCISSCSGTCSNSCGNTCASTCVSTCTGTCSVTCGGTCSSTCGSTCSSTCSATCSGTCSNTCGSTCINCAKTPAGTGAGSKAGEAAAGSNASPARSTALSPPAAEQNSLMPYNVLANPPASVYYKGVNMPWSAFNQSFSGKDLLAWIEMNDSAWETTARTPKGMWVRQLVYVPVSGDLVLNRNAPKGASNRDYGQTTPGYKYVWFYADLQGTYTGAFNIGGLQSNSIAISLN